MGKPKIRFKGFTEEWERRKLSELVLLITKGTTPLDKSGNGEINFIKIENIDPSSGEITPEMKISRKEHNGYLKRSQLQENDILFSIAGTLGRVSIVKSCVLPANTNQALAIIRTKEGDLRYLTTVLKGNAVADFIRKNPTVGAQPNLSLEQVGNIELPYPSMAEQEKIGEYFFSLDNLITLHQRKCDETKKLKKYMLQKMFPQNGMKVPEIRFEEFTGDWEQRKVGEFYDFKNGLNKGKEFFGEGTPIVNFTDVFHNRDIYAKSLKGKVTLEPNEIKNYEVKKGDIFFTRTSEMIEEIGYPSVMLDVAENTVFSGFVLRGRCCQSEDPLDDLFKKYVFFTDAFREEMLKKSSMTTRALTSGTVIKNMIFRFPKSKEEQHKIAEYLTTLDYLITLHQRKRDELVKIKKYMLQNMFV